VPQKRERLVVVLVDRDPGERARVAGPHCESRVVFRSRRAPRDEHERKCAGGSKRLTSAVRETAPAGTWAWDLTHDVEGNRAGT
jgi:hypothetical protein